MTLTGGSAGLPPAANTSTAPAQLLTPRADLVGMELEALGELGQRGIAFQGRECDLGLKAGA